MVQDIGTLSLQALRCFHTVARLGQVTAAAERLGIAKSGVSRHIGQLEAYYGVRLLERGARTVRLTHAGARLDHRIQSILAEVDLLDDIAREESVGVSGHVRVATTPEFCRLVASALFPIIRANHPELKLLMRTGYAFEDMQDSLTDIAFRIGTFSDDRLVARRLGAFRAWLVASPSFLQSHTVDAPEHLSDVPCVIFRSDQSATTWTLLGNDEKTTVSVAGSLGVRDFAVLYELALAGHGVALLPNFMLTEALETGALIRLLPGYTSRVLPVFLTYRPGARRVARLDSVIALAEEHLPDLLSTFEQ